MKVLAAVEVVLTKGEAAQLMERGTRNLQAYLSLLKSNKYNQQFNRESVAMARRYAEEAIALDPEFSAAYRTLAAVMINESFVSAVRVPQTELAQQALMLAEKGVALDQNSSSSYATLSLVHVFFSQDSERARLAAEKAVSLSPNSAYGYHALGASLMLAERFHEAIPYLEKSLRLSPIPINSGVMAMLGNSYRFIGKYEDAIAVYRRMLTIYPNNIFSHAMLACTHATIGRDPEARAEATEVMKLDPNFSPTRFVNAFLVRRNKKLLDDTLNDLRKAGLK
jgi:tetratricopeptide (TPR) repeat protein